jgi:hypothetical protein
VGRQDDERVGGETRVDVEASGGDRLFGHLVAALAEEAGEPGAGLAFASRCGIDVDERAREENWIYGIHRSDPVVVLVSALLAASLTPARRRRAA